MLSAVYPRMLGMSRLFGGLLGVGGEGSELPKMHIALVLLGFFYKRAYFFTDHSQLVHFSGDFMAFFLLTRFLPSVL